MDIFEDIFKYCDSTLRLSSRVAHSNEYFRHPTLYIKREDELSFGISGSKLRKYSSILEHFRRNNIKSVALVGGYRSNHILGLIQLLIEKRIDYHLFLKKPHTNTKEGNSCFIHLFTKKEKITYLDPREWSLKDKIILSKISKETFYLPEGADHIFSLFGGMTQAFDIDKNEKEIDKRFNHIFIDAGTGFSAISLILGQALLKKRAEIHVVLMAYEPDVFKDKLHFYQNYVEETFSISLSLPPFHLYPSSIGKSFGSTPKQVFEEIKTIARKEGMLTDPIYSAKLFYSCKEIVSEKKLSGNILCIHSGGALTLSGFSQMLNKLEL
jgi:1-aminocyclopropane-1-carboxylate deaminase/D-cysteine desulfhydrase-like pyridoxal-dependent ACC family enzyme